MSIDKIRKKILGYKNVKITENNYYDDNTQTSHKYLFLNTVNGGIKNLIGIDSVSSDWDNMNTITLSNLYDFNINTISPGTNNTNTIDYTILYSTNETDVQQNKKIFHK